jgi:hypothetical protein
MHVWYPIVGIRRHPATVARCRWTRFRLWSEAGRIWPKWPEYGQIWPDLAKMAGIRPLIRPDLIGFGGVQSESGQTLLSESGYGDRTLQNSANSCIFAFRNFFVRTKRWKIFYDGNYFMSKQIVHKLLYIPIIIINK